MSPSASDTRCPGVDEWRRLLSGALTSESRQRLREHLEHCDTCRRVVQELTGDTVHSAIVAAGPDTLGGAAGGKQMDFTFLSPPMDEEEIGWLGSYRVRGLIGEGGMGFVFDAEETHLRRRVALKVIRPEIAASPASRERFLNEARAAAALPHDRIVTIYAVGQADGVPFLAMEYLEGESLEDRLRRLGRLPLPEVLRIGREIAEGLAAAHAKGVIHRDIKPANIWLHSLPPDFHSQKPRWAVKLLDFGLARHVSTPTQLTAAGHIVGTPQYLAPEQAQSSKNLDGRTDLYALGVVLYRAVAGVLPVDGDDVLAILNAIANHQPTPLRQLVPELPRRFCALVDQLLAKDPNARPADAVAVIGELRALEQELPTVDATFAGAPAPLRAWAAGSSRRRWALWAAGASVLALVVLSAGFLGFHVKNKGNQTPLPDIVAQPMPPDGEPAPLGILFPLTGPLRDLGNAAKEAALLAVDEVNDHGGVLGRQILPVVRDGSADLDYFANQAEKLITDDHVCAILGCWTSASRKVVRPVVERYDHLLLYPVQCEGLEESPNIFYLGAAPNQQILPAIKFLVGGEQRQRVFLVGANTIYCRAVNAIIRDRLKQSYAGASVVDEMYLGPGHIERDVAAAAAAIQAKAPSLIVNTAGGLADALLTRTLRRGGLTPKTTPTLCFEVSEEEFQGSDPRRAEGDYVACNYFQSIATPQNEAFVRSFRKRYGPDRMLSDTMAKSYVGVYLWAQAVQQAKSAQPSAVRRALEGQSFLGPGGRIQIDAATHYVYDIVRIASVGPDHRAHVVQGSETAIAPEPFPKTRTRAQWEKFLEDLYRLWGNRWEARPDS